MSPILLTFVNSGIFEECLNITLLLKSCLMIMRRSGSVTRLTKSLSCIYTHYPKSK